MKYAYFVHSQENCRHDQAFVRNLNFPSGVFQMKFVTRCSTADDARSLVRELRLRENVINAEYVGKKLVK